MTGADIPIPECQLAVHQPTIKEIGMIGENDFNVGAQLLCIDKEAFEDIEGEITNFNLLMMVFNEKEAADKKQTVKTILSLVLPNYQIIFTPRSILCNKGDENLIIDEENFESLQKVLRKIFCIGKKKESEDDIPETYTQSMKRLGK